MKKKIFIFIVSVLVCSHAMAVGTANNYVQKRFNTITSHNDTYPYVLNNTKKTSTSNTKKASATTARRAVVPRTTASRSAVNNTFVSGTNSAPQRRVVQRNNTQARAATNTSPMRVNSRNINARSGTQVRNISTVRTKTQNTTYDTSSTEKVSSQRCFADYKLCMEDYCKREDTAYNRCYCSAKLAQIDSKYQNKIDDLIQQIIRLKYNSGATSEDIKEYWDRTVGIYTHDNPWVNIDNALNIEWADTQSRVRGQNAFNTGHQYCIQNLRACHYMASNLRDAYKSEITRDCETYEKNLQKIQDAAESVIESYHD